MILAKKGHKPWNKGKKGVQIPSEKTRKKMSDSHKGKGLGKDNPMFGRKHTEEEKKKMSERMKGKFVGKNHPMYGRHHLPESRKRISEKMKGEKNPNFGKHPTPWNLGIPRTEEEKKKMSENRKGIPSWNKDKTGVYSEESLRRMSEGRKGKTAGKDNPMFGRKHTPETRKIIREKRWLQDPIPKEGNKFELSVFNALRERGIEFEQHKKIIGIPDIFIKPNLCIFLDSDYHHANPSKYPDDFQIWPSKGVTAKSKRLYDKKIRDELRAEGYKIIDGLWYSDWKKDKEKFFQKILKAIKESRR